MTETKIVLTVTHTKPLPEGATDVIAQRFYGWSYSRGVEVGVTATMGPPPINHTCLYPSCNCPMDPGPDPDWCARGYPHERKERSGD
jgi:hypothetical protein